VDGEHVRPVPIPEAQPYLDGDAVEEELHAPLRAGQDRHGAAMERRVAHQPATELQQPCRVAGWQEEPGVDGGERLVTARDVRDGFKADDLIQRQRASQLHVSRFETE
jgi:hypothetical protein